jgi:hypothetical protein
MQNPKSGIGPRLYWCCTPPEISQNTHFLSITMILPITHCNLSSRRKFDYTIFVGVLFFGRLFWALCQLQSVFWLPSKHWDIPIAISVLKPWLTPDPWSVPLHTPAFFRPWPPPLFGTLKHSILPQTLTPAPEHPTLPQIVYSTARPSGYSPVAVRADILTPNPRSFSTQWI